MCAPPQRQVNLSMHIRPWLMTLWLLCTPGALAAPSASPAPSDNNTGQNDRHVIELNLGALLGNVSPHKAAFDLVYTVLKDISRDPDKVTSFNAQLPHTVHVGDELEFVVSEADDSATLVFDGLTQTLQRGHALYRKRITVRKEGENFILFSIAQGVVNPGAWRGDLVVRNLTTGEELIDHHPAGNDFLMPGRKRVYLFSFQARRHWHDVFH